MKIPAAVVLLHLYLSLTAALSGNFSTTVTAAPGDVVILPCYTDGVAPPTLTTWAKDGQEIIQSVGSSRRTTSDLQRVAVLHDGSLSIANVIPGDEGRYLCNSTLSDHTNFRARVLLQVTADPENLSTFISPAFALHNGTLFTNRGSTVIFNCSGSSDPSQQLTWAFRGATSSNDSLVSTSGSRLNFTIEDIQPGAQGVYSCIAHNTITHQAVNKSRQLLVYYVPDRHPQCTWAPAMDPSHFQFNCTWFGAYPTPKLSWEKGQGDPGAGLKGQIYAWNVTDNLSVTLNRSVLSDGQTLRCMAQHLWLAQRDKNSCSFTLKPPFPEGEPLVMAQEGKSITLICSENVSTPPANTSWRKGFQEEDIVPGSKYALSEEGPVLKLTIFNVSKVDEGLYFCRSENPLAVRELEVYLTVRTSSAYTGVIIGIFIAVLIVGSSVVLAKTLYSSRHQICLGGGFGQVEDDRGDVLNLVESDDENVFQDAVPRLPPLTNGHHTTLVQIHRIPSSDHEDVETADTSPEQQEETVPTEEPVDLLKF